MIPPASTDQHLDHRSFYGKPSVRLNSSLSDSIKNTVILQGYMYPMKYTMSSTQCQLFVMEGTTKRYIADTKSGPEYLLLLTEIQSARIIVILHH